MFSQKLQKYWELNTQRPLKNFHPGYSVTVKEKPYDNPVDQTNTRRMCLLYTTETDVSVTSSAQKQAKCLCVWDKQMLFPLRCGFSGGGFPSKQTSASFNAIQQISVNANICCSPHV